ncbi:MAG: sodium-translocating pyrophosphatase [Elusimicrobia bacterium]|nr:sodium-translocating pyrophosphatase [Elusimicrobiota bacterium]
MVPTFLFYVSLACAIIGLIAVLIIATKILKASPGNSKMIEISELIHEGAMAFLTKEYAQISIFVLAVAIIIYFFLNKWMPVAFISGAVFSILAGFIGMSIATRSNGRCAQAATFGLNEALNIAFPGGMVMGLSVASLGLMGLSLMFIFFMWQRGLTSTDIAKNLLDVTNIVVGFSMGASSVALFARVGGGIYTKAADVGADLVGKVEAGIPEDDPRNPAVIADNVGDNVGDVAGMGADLYESYIGAIISACVIAASSSDIKGIFLPLILVSWGLISSIIGKFFVRVSEKTSAQEALRNGLWASAILFIMGGFAITFWWYENPDIARLGPFAAIISGLIAGLIVGFAAEYYTSGKMVQKIAEASTKGPATNILSGLTCGMYSTGISIVVIALATIISYKVAGIYGVALSAVGMLSITGMTVAVDAYGPIADNAAGIAEMAHLGPEVRKRAEQLDAVGNTTAAIGKGFAIGSAALTALALFTAYAQVANLEINPFDKTPLINILNAKVVAGLFLGGVVAFIFTAMTLSAVNKAAGSIVEEVRRQFREIPGLMEGKALPDSATCVGITTKDALSKMRLPGILAVIMPILVGTVLGGEALGGFLAGSLVTGVPLALFLANAGGAWDNAKKYVEEGNLGGKGSDVHKATVIGDTVGDPCKDTSGPSINILLKLMSIVSLVFAPLIFKLHDLFLDLF